MLAGGERGSDEEMDEERRPEEGPVGTAGGRSQKGHVLGSPAEKRSVGHVCQDMK